MPKTEINFWKGTIGAPIVNFLKKIHSIFKKKSASSGDAVGLGAPNMIGRLVSYGPVQNISLDKDSYIFPFFSKSDLDNHKKKWKSLGISWRDNEECVTLDIEVEGESLNFEKDLKKSGLTPFPHKFPSNIFEGKKQGDTIAFNYTLPVEGERIAVPLEITLKQELGTFEEALEGALQRKKDVQATFEIRKAAGLL